MQNSEPLVKMIRAADVYPLRLLVLRPGGTLQDCIWPNDDATTTVHFGATNHAGDILAVASFYLQHHPDLTAHHPVQLRGMASHPDVRGQGYGKAIVRHAAAHFCNTGCDVMWCNAREVAVGFYENLGFAIQGEPFFIPKIGKHWVMSFRLNS